MKEQIMLMCLGMAIGWLSRQFVSWWVSHREKIKAELLTLDEKIQEKMGVELPASLHEKYDTIVTKAVGFVDKYASDPRFVREVLRSLQARDLDKWTRFTDWLKAIDWKTELWATLPEDLKPIVNEAKEATAVKLIAANAAKALPAEHVPDEPKIRASVQTAVAAVKIDTEPQPINKDTLERLIAESQERQRILSGK